jgi:hypothetical protein
MLFFLLDKTKNIESKELSLIAVSVNDNRQSGQQNRNPQILHIKPIVYLSSPGKRKKLNSLSVLYLLLTIIIIFVNIKF